MKQSKQVGVGVSVYLGIPFQKNKDKYGCSFAKFGLIKNKVLRCSKKRGENKHARKYFMSLLILFIAK